MKVARVWMVSVVAAVVLVGGGVAGAAEVAAVAEVSAPAAAVAAPSADEVVVGTGDLKAMVAVGGVFVPGKSDEVRWAPKSGAAMKVVSAATAGSRVKKGDVLLSLDTTELDRKVADLEAGVRLAEISLKLAQEDLKDLEATTPEQLKWARRAARVVEEDFEEYKRSDAAFNERMLKLDMEGAEVALETQKSDLAELERMYKADDLLEPTEKLVLRRERYQLERQQMAYEQRTKFSFPYRKVTNAREMEEWEKRVKDAKRALAEAEVSIPLALERRQLEMKKTTADVEAVKRALADARADRAGVTELKAPADGVVYYGRCVRGAWVGGAELTAGLPAPGEVWFTVVQGKELRVRAEVAEKDLGVLRVGMDAVVSPTGWPGRRLKGKVTGLSIVPGGPQPYVVDVAVTGGDATGVMAGMTCAVSLVAGDVKGVVVVPAGVVFADPDDVTRSVVYCVAGGKVKKVRVELGVRADDRVEVVKGLKKGDVVRTKEPKE